MNVIVVGASGFGRELLQYVQDAHGDNPGVRIKGFLDDDPAKAGGAIVGDTLTYAIGEEDRFIISLGDPGPVTRQIQGVFDDTLCGRVPQYAEWLDIVQVPSTA